MAVDHLRLIVDQLTSLLDEEHRLACSRGWEIIGKDSSAHKLKDAIAPLTEVEVQEYLSLPRGDIDIDLLQKEGFLSFDYIREGHNEPPGVFIMDMVNVAELLEANSDAITMEQLVDLDVRREETSLALGIEQADSGQTITLLRDETELAEVDPAALEVDIDGAYNYCYPRVALTADIAVLRTVGGLPKILLIKRGGEPFLDCWALAGGFVNHQEPARLAAARELHEETGVEVDSQSLVELGFFDGPYRDPRGWTATSAWLIDIGDQEVTAVASDDAKDVQWFGFDGLPELAFDHALIIERACEYLLKRP